MICIYYTELKEEYNNDVLEKALQKMPQNIVDEINQYKFEQQRWHTFLGKKLLEFALSENNFTHTLSDIKYYKKEKPYLTENIDFNISHSGDYVILAFVQNNNVGIDIEKHRNIDNTLFKKYFNDVEWKNIQEANKPNSIFFDYWAIKESAIKCDGRGVEILGKTYIYDESSLLCDEQIYYYKKLKIDEKYSASVCTKQQDEILKIKKIELSILL